MVDGNSRVQAADVMSVGTRISWGAILAGAAVAVAMQFLLGILGAAVGVSVTGRVDPSNLRIAAVIWTVVVVCAALFMGGMVTTQFTAGENKVEAMLYGIIMWAVLVAVSVGLGGIVSSSFNTLMMAAESPQTNTVPAWDQAARNAGIPAEQIEDWRRKLAPTRGKDDPDARTSERQADRARLSWYVFGGTWLSVFAAAAGAVVGSGPTFRIFLPAERSRAVV